MFFPMFFCNVVLLRGPLIALTILFTKPTHSASHCYITVDNYETECTVVPTWVLALLFTFGIGKLHEFLVCLRVVRLELQLEGSLLLHSTKRLTVTKTQSKVV